MRLENELLGCPVYGLVMLVLHKKGKLLSSVFVRCSVISSVFRTLIHVADRHRDIRADDCRMVTHNEQLILYS